VQPTARGDPESPLRWTCRSTYNLAAELRRQGFQVGPRTVARELREQDFTLQANRKTREGDAHPDRDAQFHYIKRTGSTVSATRSARGLGGHEEERAGGPVPERGAGMAAQGAAGRGLGP